MFNFEFAQEDQIKLIRSCQDVLLKEQITLIESVVECCPDRKLRKHGKRLSDYHAIFTNHKLTIFAALKQGLSPKTNVTALCDGADNCWQIVDPLTPLCTSITRILNWFHLSMKIQNITLQKELKSKLIRIKWHLWRGKTDNALIRLDELIAISTSTHNPILKN